MTPIVLTESHYLMDVLDTYLLQLFQEITEINLLSALFNKKEKKEGIK